MEAATLSSPQRKLDVVPVQKSLSLPSYARAGGEGIDHTIIFAALEQREKVRRKSRIFTREKTARQNIFCLPIPSGKKCRETSLSSDTSCSSLEYQKPKSSSKPKKDEKETTNETTANELSTAKTNQSEVRTNSSHKNVATPSAEASHEVQRNSLKIDHLKGQRSPSDTLRPNVHSSDSMERSSRSSNDSLSRKERLVAIKAKVEAAREKYGDTSSEDESRSAITRYNSDGVIHRSVREVKSKSYRLEKRLRRRSQDEYALKKLNRKNNLSLCLNSAEDGIKLDLDRPFNIFEESQNTECKTDFCPSPNFLDIPKKNYFSDYPSRDNVSRIVQTRIRILEEEERKRRNSSDFRDKTKISSRQSPQSTENSSPFSTQHRNVFSNQNAVGSLDMEKNSPSSDILHCPSPVGRAPTPPPRSPKSITFVNKAYIQHQNAYLNHDTHSLERKPYFQPNIPVTAKAKCADKMNSKTEGTSNDSKTSLDSFDDASEKRRMRELFNSRRKTCGFFDYTDNYLFKELNSSSDKITPSKSPILRTNLNASQTKSSDTKGYSSGSETPCAVGGEMTQRSLRSKWEENEKRQEFMFNSLESKKKAMSPSWAKWPGTSSKNENCLCQILSGNKSVCTCNYTKRNINNVSSSSSISNNAENQSKFLCINDTYQSCRLSKSEINLVYSDQTKTNLLNITSFPRENQSTTYRNSKEKLEINGHSEKTSATANLDSAMEELESVYRSLKFSSDNLSEKNSTSNLSLNDLNAETPKNGIFNKKSANNDFQLKSSSYKEDNFNLHTNKPSYMKPAADKKPLEFLKLSVFSPPTTSTKKSLESENLCIDELFNDLTRQLDIEQKLLRESRDNRNENRTVDIQTDKDDKREMKRMTPLESIVSIRKELYDNLQKNSHGNARPYNPSYVSKGTDGTKDSELETARKKYKAVRSLSENISYLMATTNPKPVRKTPEPSNYNMETTRIEKPSLKLYEHVILEPLKIETKKELSSIQPAVPKRTFLPDKQKKSLTEEIRQIRVSMDSNASESTPSTKKQYSEYPRLTSAVCRPHVSPKSETSSILPPSNPSSNIPKETIDILDENGLEKLLNTLLKDVPDSKQSSLLLSRDEAQTPPPPATSAGKCDHVTYKRNILPSRMDAYMAATTKSQIPTTDSSQRLKAEEIAQVKNDFRQNSPHLNQISFIPVYSNKTACHKLPKSKNESENGTSERKVLTTYSPPARPRCIGNNDMFAARIAKTHLRRRSVGFEDMTSLSSYYGHNFTNDRFQGSVQNSNISQAAENQGTFLQSDLAQSIGKINQHENMCFSSWNHNTQLASSENANDQLPQRSERTLQRFKDKSSKRKSSLNRMDFIQFPSPNAGGLQYHSDISQHKNSSSDEDSECRFQTKKAESPSGTTKRKHSASSTNHTTAKSETRTNEVTLRHSSPSKSKLKILPKSSQLNHPNSRQNRWKHPSSIRFAQKLSHSAGELESLRDLSEVPTRNRTYLSAQEFEDQECSHTTFNSSTSVRTRNNFQKFSPRQFRKNETVASKNSCDIASLVNTNNELTNECSFSKEIVANNLDLSKEGTSDYVKSIDQTENASEIKSEQNVMGNLGNSDAKIDCGDSKKCDDEMETSVIKLENLEITDDSKNTDISLSADESGEAIGSDGERRPSSILRKKSSDDRKELHSILKQPLDDKFSKTPPSILKNRESSEEKDVWQPNDLHSILKKSTSEDESCNSGPDIRPILKFSTDDDSPSGAVRPRPILKKRTSFSDECSYVSFSSGDLKPILKKKTSLSSDDQPKPILKSRRKSEDTRSTISEIITSRPRAYSADMGVKMNYENQTDGSDVRADFCKLDSHDL